MQFLKIPSLVLACCSIKAQKQISCMVFWGYLLAPADRTSASSFTHFENHFNFSFKNSPWFETGFTRMFLQFTQTKALIPTCNDHKISTNFNFSKTTHFLNVITKRFSIQLLSESSQNHIIKHNHEERYDHAFALPRSPEEPEKH